MQTATSQMCHTQSTTSEFQTHESRLSLQLCKSRKMIDPLNSVSRELINEMENQCSLSMPPRPRSKRPRDPRAASEPSSTSNRQQALTMHCSVPTKSHGPVSANYRQLSTREAKSLKLDPHRRYFKCLVDGCDRVFGRKSNVENHIRAHLDDKPFVCSLNTW